MFVKAGVSTPLTNNICGLNRVKFVIHFMTHTDLTRKGAVADRSPEGLMNLNHLVFVSCRKCLQDV